MAWAVEILVAFIGLCIGIIVIRGAQGVTEASDLISKGISLNDLTIGMIFIIVAVVDTMPMHNTIDTNAKYRNTIYIEFFHMTQK